jgi:hemerythrin-like domain-containing protein
MTNPIEVLRAEHIIIESGLRALSAMCLRLERGEKVAPAAFSTLLDLIRTFADDLHHAKEERCLFPALEARGLPRAGGPIGVMLYEHDLGRRLTAEMAQATEDYQTGEPEASQRLVNAASRYIELLSAHIHKENNILFMIAESMLDEPARASLRQEFEQAEAGRGASLRKQYERIAAQLEREWAV